ncbi:MAG: hypothetical protein ABI210_12260 [Abditibacteriaceae bacterium]
MRIAVECRLSAAERYFLTLPKVLLFTSNSIMSSLHNKFLSHSTQEPTTKTSSSQTEKETNPVQPVVKLAPSMWLRAMTDFDAPFGHDGLPTVWG